MLIQPWQVPNDACSDLKPLDGLDTMPRNGLTHWPMVPADISAKILPHIGQYLTRGACRLMRLRALGKINTSQHWLRSEAMPLQTDLVTKSELCFCRLFE